MPISIFLKVLSNRRIFSDNTTLKRITGGRDELIFVNYRDIRDLNPHLYAGEMYAQSILYDTLVSITADGYEGCLAESWDISEDGRVHGAPPTIVIKEARSPVSIKSFSSFFCSDIVDVSRALVPIISA